MLVVEPWRWTTLGDVPMLGLGPVGTEVGGGSGLEGWLMGLQGCSIDTIKGMSVGSRGGLLPSMDKSIERPGELVLLSKVSGTLPSLTSFFATYSLALVNSCIQPFIFVFLNTPLREDIVSRIFNRKT